MYGGMYPEHILDDNGKKVANPEDQGYCRGGTPVFTGVIEPLARVTLYLTDENGLDSCFGAA